MPSIETSLPFTWEYFNVIAPVVRHLLRKRYGYELAKRAYDRAQDGPVYDYLIEGA